MTEGEALAIRFNECISARDVEGPALWSAVVQGDRLSEWRVYDDSPETRRRLGLEGD